MCGSTPRAWGRGLHGLVLCVAVCLSSATRAAAQQTVPYNGYEPFPNASGSAASRRPGQGLDLRATLFAGLDFGGRERRSDSRGSQDDPLAPAFSLGGRLELSTSAYIAVGVFVDYVRTDIVFARPEPDGDARARAALLGLGVWLKARVPVRVGSYDLDIYLGVPLGMAVLRPPDVAGLSARTGFVFGSVGGVDIALNDHVGLFAEVGFRANLFGQVEEETSRERVGLLQAVARIGAGYSF